MNENDCRDQPDKRCWSFNAGRRVVFTLRFILTKERNENRHVGVALHAAHNMRINRNKDTRNQHMLLAPEAKSSLPRKGLDRDRDSRGMISQERAPPYSDQHQLPPSISKERMYLAI